MNQEVLDRVLASPRLPSLPSIALEIIDLVQQRDVKIKQIADTIQNDPALCSKILKTVNSSFYAQSKPVSTLSQALVILGLNSIRTLALGFTLTNNLKKSGSADFDHSLLWRRSIYSATAAKVLSKQIHLVHQEEAFLGALMQDLGMLAMVATLGDPYLELTREVGSAHRELVALETARLKISHPELGSALAAKWNLPPVLTNVIRFHDDPLGAPEKFSQLTKCVAVGNIVADLYISAEPGPALDEYYQRASEWLDLAQDQAEPLLKTIHRDTVEMKRLFDLPTGDLGSSDAILARANEAMVQVSLQVAQQTDALAHENRRLHEQARTDSLTGVANRRQLNDYLAEKFAAATAAKPLTVLFLDTDHFKQFNDTYGHQVGDKVLVDLAGVLGKMTPEGAMVARYGGEELAVVLPDCNRVVGARLAEAIRGAIAETPVETEDGQVLQVTASVGVASHDGTFFGSDEQLVKAADQAVYAAKAAGRNCVRFFTPKVPAKSKVA